jgi:hypothetical protein
LQWDDFALLTRPEFARPSWSAIKFFWSTTFLGHYTPLTWMSWGTDRWMWGGTPLGFHLTNLLLHAANAALVSLLARRVLRRFCSASDEAMTAGAVAAALFFSLHPLRVETVAWVTERRGLLSAFFGLAAALAHERNREARAKPWVAPALLLAAVLSKETAVMWPPALTVWAWIRGGSDARERRGLAILWVVGMTGAVTGFWADHRDHVPVSWEEFGPHARLANALRAFPWAAFKTAWPSGLAPLYQVRPVSPGRGVEAGAGALLTAAAAAGLRRKSPWAAAWIVQVLFLLPTCGIFQSGPQETADRYTYAACLPWAFFVGAWAARVFGSARAGRASGTAALLVLSAWIGGLAGMSVRQQKFWRTPETFWSRVTDVSPHSDYGWTSLGQEVGREGRWEEALGLFRRALALNPTSARAMYGTGAALDRLGRRAEAELYYRRTLVIDPAHPKAGKALESLLAKGRP